MRQISTQKITEEVKKMCISSNCNLNDDIYIALNAAKETEISPVGCEMLSQLITNADIAKNRRVEIVVQRNLHKNLDHYQNTYMKMGKTEQQRRRNEQIKIIREIDNKDIEALGEDIQQTYEETGSEFLDESQRIERLSNPK